jgi:hypothetical protein
VHPVTDEQALALGMVVHIAIQRLPGKDALGFSMIGGVDSKYDAPCVYAYMEQTLLTN